MSPTEQISICIPTWERTHMVMKAIEKVLDDPRVGEIVIVDDASSIGTWFELESMFNGTHVKYKLLRNTKNLDCYANKKRAIMNASNDWCILLDSDNVIDTTFLDAIYALPEWVSDTFYAPEFAQPNFDYTPFSGKWIDKHNVHSHVGTKAFDCLINTANYFVHKGTYLWVFDPEIDPHAADTIFMNTKHLSSGGKIYVVPGMQYFHRVHDGSHYKANQHKSSTLFEDLKNQLSLMR
jgi:glycosyltransferase involved in cell wall biosynthesis